MKKKKKVILLVVLIGVLILSNILFINYMGFFKPYFEFKSLSVENGLLQDNNLIFNKSDFVDENKDYHPLRFSFRFKANRFMKDDIEQRLVCQREEQGKFTVGFTESERTRELGREYGIYTRKNVDWRFIEQVSGNFYEAGIMVFPDDSKVYGTHIKSAKPGYDFYVSYAFYPGKPEESIKFVCEFYAYHTDREVVFFDGMNFNITYTAE